MKFFRCFLSPASAAGLLLIAFALEGKAAPDVVFADFEGGDFGGWTASGEAFGKAPARGTLPNQQAVAGFEGSGYVSSYHGGDGSQGKLVSPSFKIANRHISFLVGGGHGDGKAVMRLIVDGKPVRTASGANDERLALRGWDVADLRGKTARIEIVDEATGGWGHLNVDHIIFTDRDVPVIDQDASRKISAAAKWLLLPVKNGAPIKTVTVKVDGAEERRFTIELADGDPDWWAPLDVSAWRGKPLTVAVDQLARDSRALKNLNVSDVYPAGPDLYEEPLRPRFHFSSRRGWLNDPNGLVYYQGLYHLFYQHNPYGREWGNMHWGHAVSPDLVHWEEVGEALYPDHEGTMYSGSAVDDRKNTSGFGRDGKSPMVLFYTAAGEPFVQSMASSLDGRNFTKYRGNPIVKNTSPGNRDPKVFWFEPGKHWVMVYWEERDGLHQATVLNSKNLRDWHPVGAIEGKRGTGYLFECPDLFPLRVDGQAGNEKWVVFGANGEYGVGAFDGKKFTLEAGPFPGPAGDTNYAAQTFSDEPKGRRVLVGWLRAPSPGMPFNNCLSIPLELALVSTPEGPKMTYAPVEELRSLRGKAFGVRDVKLAEGAPNPLRDFRGDVFELRTELKPAGGGVITFDVRGTPVVYDVPKQELRVEGRVAKAPLRDGKLDIAIFMDRTAMEIFAAGGRAYVPVAKIPAADNRALGVSVSGDPVEILRLDVYPLASAWKTAAAAP